MKINNPARGSALLVALIITGMLLMLSLGISEIIIGASRSARALTDRTAAWYKAESGMELALNKFYGNGPGFETQEVSAENDYEYRIIALSARIPKEKDEFAVLRLNESVVIPLQAKEFRADYYVEPKVHASGFADDDLDILRWKLFGIAPDGVMEVMNEFVPANRGNSAGSPTCFGTSAQCYNAARFYERSPEGFNINEYRLISDFLSSHRQNFLVITNMMDPEFIDAPTLSDNEKKRIANVLYRVISLDGAENLTLPETIIESDGYSNDIKQSLTAKVKRSTALPVFNFALYRTVE